MTSLRWTALALLGQPLLATAFSTSYSTPSQCGSYTLSFTHPADERTGPPYTLLLLPFDGVPVILNLPQSIYNAAEQRGEFTLDALPLASGTQFIAVLDDGFARGSGGVSFVQTVGEGSGDASCISTETPADSFITLSTEAPTQCGQLSISWTDEVQDSGTLSIRGFVPGGIAFGLDAPQEPRSDWTVNIRDGTSFVILIEGPGELNRSTTPLLTVQGSDGEACINENSPSSTAVADPGATPSKTPVDSTPTPSSSSTRRSTSNSSSRSTSETADAPGPSDDGSAAVSNTASVTVTVLGALVCLISTGMF